MTYSFDIPIDLVFFLFFVLGFAVGVITILMIIDYARMRAEYAEKYNCMGVRKPTPNRAPIPLPENPHK